MFHSPILLEHRKGLADSYRFSNGLLVRHDYRADVVEVGTATG